MDEINIVKIISTLEIWVIVAFNNMKNFRLFIKNTQMSSNFSFLAENRQNRSFKKIVLIKQWEGFDLT